MLSYTDTRYEISMCDLVDGKIEVVLIPGKNILYIRQNKADVFVNMSADVIRFERILNLTGTTT
jgi:hypothetical protein